MNSIINGIGIVGQSFFEGLFNGNTISFVITIIIDIIFRISCFIKGYKIINKKGKYEK